MSDFIKGRTTVTSRIEKVESLEPPTVTVCFYPPYKPSKLIALGITDPTDPIYSKDSNTSFEERINSLSYSLGKDLSMNLTLTLGYDYESSRSWTVPAETDSPFVMETVLPYNMENASKSSQTLKSLLMGLA